MLEKIDLNKKLDAGEYKAAMRELEPRLAMLQLNLLELNIPVIITMEGWSAAGKGTQMRRIVYPLDPRHFNVYAMSKVSEEMKMRPFLWSYWVRTPSKGRIAIFDRSWSRDMLPGLESQWGFSEREKQGYFHDVNAFERQLLDGGTVIIKLFLHISKEEQKERVKKLIKSPDTKWRVRESDFKDYDKSLAVFENMIHHTSTGDSLWHIIEANDKYYATVKIFNVLTGLLEEAVARKAAQPQKIDREPFKAQPEVSVLSAAETSAVVSKKDYNQRLATYQARMSELGSKLYARRQPVAIVYEGWDAAGKGGNIKRLTEELDPRGYEVAPICAPAREELDHHYLWRFYNKLPKDGHVAIFDRSWYGRVLVERVEGFCEKEEWMRAYKEINEMELHWANHGMILFKFWLNIDKDEQLRRFEARRDNPAKQHKITDEDWRNREKWDGYEQAVNDMLIETSTDYAPWTIVPSNDKRYARLFTLETVVGELEKRLK